MRVRLIVEVHDGFRSLAQAKAKLAGVKEAAEQAVHAGERQLASIIDASAHDPATAYVAVKRMLLGDQAPYIYRTNDYGQTWTKIVNGLRDDDFVHAVRADPQRQGLLYAGTQHGFVHDRARTARRGHDALHEPTADAREQVNELKKYDPVKMTKNLDDNKKRLAEKTSAAEVLQKSLGKTKSENAELLKKVAELEARVAELEPVVEETEESEREAA